MQFFQRILNCKFLNYWFHIYWHLFVYANFSLYKVLQKLKWCSMLDFERMACAKPNNGRNIGKNSHDWFRMSFHSTRCVAQMLKTSLISSLTHTHHEVSHAERQWLIAAIMTLIATSSSHPSMESKNVREKSAGCIITSHRTEIRKWLLHTHSWSEWIILATAAELDIRVIQSKVKVV